MLTAVADQDAILKNQLKTGRNTEFGNNHFLKDVTSYEDFKEAIPIRNYEQLKNYIELIKEGKHNV
ncbi:MAG TPA: GH3 auxin-responsive promoter family protein, partial [Niabella sp.]|nr:GH3 auxin-responsive promoter family protein [Niabella sp.]